MEKMYGRIILIILIVGIISTVFITDGSAAFPIISNISVDNVKDTSTEITFNVSQNDARTIIRYGTTTSSLAKKSDWNNDTSLTRAIHIDGLVRGTKYFYKIYAYNGTNSSYYKNSSIRSFTTIKPTMPNITDIGIEDVGVSTAEIAFNVSQIDANTRIYYGETRSLGTWGLRNNDKKLRRNIMLSDLLNGTKYYYSIYAYNGTNNSYYKNSSIRNFTTDYPSPNIVNTSPERIVETTIGEPINFTVFFDQIVNVTWYLNETKVKTENLVTSSYYLNNASSVGTRNVTVKGRNTRGNVSYSWMLTVYPKTYKTGNRIWDASKGMSTTYTWNSHSFAGFYYDIDNNLNTEELTIRDIKRTIDDEDITYTTSPIEVSFDYPNFGKYQVIGFMADKYFAGYTINSTISNGEKDVAGNGQLHKVIIDDDIKRTISVGSTITLRDGYVLKATDIDVGAGPGQIWVVLLKDGREIDNDIIAPGENYIYKKKVGSVDDLPIIAIHFDSVFRGREVNAAFIKGLFQISDSYTEIKTGNKYGKMEISEVSKSKISMENKESISLSAGSIIDLMGDLKIIVADSNILRFALSVERAGTFEVRGTVYPVTNEWSPMNFGLNVGSTNIGFYYDIDEDIGTEKFKIESINTAGKSISEGKLIYSTSPQEVSFSYSSFGKYGVIGFTANKYFAGYTINSSISGNKEINTIEKGQLYKILLDDEDKRTVSVGGTFTLKEGYVLKMKEIDVGAGPGQVWIVLLKDGNEVDNDVVVGGNTYIYSKKVGSVEDLPVIAVRIESVFRGKEINAAFIKGVFQISDSYTEIKTGNKYGKMEVSGISKDKISMKSRDTIGLSSGSKVDLMGDIKFKVADSSSLRFYPFVTVTSEMLEDKLILDVPNTANAGDTIDIKVTAGNNSIEGTSIIIDPGIGLLDNKTDNDGVLRYTLPTTIKGKYTITAIKPGYQNATKTIDIQQYIENKLSINVPARVDQFNTVSIIIKSKDPISDATVMFDNDTIGLTDNNGILNYTFNVSGIHSISALKTGYITVFTYIDVREAYSEFKALDIVMPSQAITDEKILIKSNITNAGTKADTGPIDLIINDISISNKSITLFPDEIKEIAFEYKVSVPVGNYTIKILGQERLLEVKEAPLNIALIGILSIIIGTVIIYFVTRKK